MLHNGTYLTWGARSALNMQSSDIYLLLVFLAFAPSFWQDCEMKSWTTNTCIPSGVFAFFSHLRHQNEKTNLHFFGSQIFSCLNGMCVWWFYYDLIEKHHAPVVNNDTMVPPAFSHSLLVYHPPPNLSVCASTRLQTSVFPPGWLQGRRRCRPIIN